MPESNNKQTTPQEQTTPGNEAANTGNQPMQVRNPFTGEEVAVTHEQLDSIEKQIDAQTERD